MAASAKEDSLQSFVTSVVGESHLRVEEDLGDGFVLLESSEAQRRQAAHDIRSTEDIVIELLRNARDAHAHSIFLSVTREDKRRRIVMIDDGDGVPPALHTRIFEPRVTSKLDTMHIDKWGVHGRGMALYAVAVNAETARVVASAPGKGTSILVETDLDKLGEKADQSTFPEFELTEEGTVAVRGPRNILRTACEFAVDAAQSCTLYVGSATDVAATLYALGLSSLTASMRAFCTDSSELPIPKRLSVAPDAASLAAEAAALGLELSERSARRIMDGQRAPLSPLTDRIHIKGLEPKRRKRLARQTSRNIVPPDARSIQFAEEDMNRFMQKVRDAYKDLAAAYYLEEESDITTKVSNGSITLTIPYARQD